MILTCALAAALLLMATMIGGAVVEAIAPAPADRAFLGAASPLLGIAVVLLLLDLVELPIPLRVGAWVVPGLTVLAAGYLLKRRALAWPGFGALAIVLIGVAAGALPTAIAGRATVVALTNDDATYYLAAAERLVSHAWLEHPDDGRGPFCLSENVIHGWLWRTGVANLAGTVIVIARVDGTAAIAAVTSALTGLVVQAAAALGVACGMPLRARWSRAVAAGGVVLSAAPIFLGWQHFLGQLAAFAIFPVGLASLSRASLQGGWRRMTPAALLLGAAMNTFADAAPVMVLGVGSVLFLGGVHGVPRRVGRILATGVIAAALFPMTLWRAAWAGFGTAFVRPRTEVSGLFLQRGWLGRTPVDDLATLVGVDPWPPWPAPWPPTPASIVEYAAIASALVLLVAALAHVRRRPGYVAAAGSGVVVLMVVMGLVSNRYLRGKCLLLEASMIIPAVAVAPFVVARGRWLVGVFAVWLSGGLVALLQLMRPAGFHVMDETDHDRLTGALARIPAGSLFVLDGFGAPTDVVHDEHRAMRAAHANGLVPVQPGLDGGFFKPICEDPAVRVVPGVGWALQRAGTEALSGGGIVERFGRFTLRKVDLSDDDAVVGAWAPTFGWLRAETEPDGTVLRWGEELASGTLRVVTRGGCGRLTGEVRSVNAVGSYSLSVAGTLTLTDLLTPVWAPFRTGPFSVVDEVPVVVRASVSAPDEAHAIALRRLAFVTDPSCLRAVARHGEAPRGDLFPDDLRTTNIYEVEPAIGVRCGTLEAMVEAPQAGAIVLAAAHDSRLTGVSSGRPTVSSLPIDFRRTHSVSVQRVVDREPGEEWRVVALRLRPGPCEDERP